MLARVARRVVAGGRCGRGSGVAAIHMHTNIRAWMLPHTPGLLTPDMQQQFYENGCVPGCDSVPVVVRVVRDRGDCIPFPNNMAIYVVSGPCVCTQSTAIPL